MLKQLETGTAPLLALFITLTATVGITSFYTTIMTRNHLPIILYLWSWSSSFVVIFILHTAIPEMVQISKFSKKIHDRLQLLPFQTCLFNHDKKLMIKGVKALQHLRLNVGLFDHTLFYFKRSTRITLYQNIVSYTISALLLFPRSRLSVYS